MLKWTSSEILLNQPQNYIEFEKDLTASSMTTKFYQISLMEFIMNFKRECSHLQSIFKSQHMLEDDEEGNIYKQAI